MAEIINSDQIQDHLLRYSSWEPWPWWRWGHQYPFVAGHKFSLHKHQHQPILTWLIKFDSGNAMILQTVKNPLKIYSKFSNQIMDEGRIMSLISNYSWTSQKEQGIVYEGVGLSLSLMMSKLIPSLLCFVGKLFCPQFHADLGCLSRSG